MPTSSATDRLRTRDRQGGFTLMEVVLAMTIIAMLAALGMPFLRPGGGVTALRMKTFEIAALLRSERNAALRFGSTTTVLVNAEAGTIRSTLSATRIDMPSSMSIRLQPKGLAGIQFFADGRASGARLVIVSGNNATAVSVNAVTAAVNTADVVP